MLAEPKYSSRNCKHFPGVRHMESRDESTEIPVCAASPDPLRNPVSWSESRGPPQRAGSPDTAGAVALLSIESWYDEPCGDGQVW